MNDGRRKLIVVIAFSCAWIAVGVMRLRFGVDPTQLDASWWLGLVAMFQQGAISGRDFQFTYGPLEQVVAWLGAAVTKTGSALDGLTMSLVAACLLSTIVFAIAMLIAREISWRKAAFIYVIIAFLNLFTEPASARLTLLILCCVMISRSVTEPGRQRRQYLLLSTGVACFVAQLSTPEVGILGFMTSLCVIAIEVLPNALKPVATGMSPLRGFLTDSAALGLGFLGGNVFLSLFFVFSSPAYPSVFAYQRYAVQTIVGYQNGMGLPWEMNLWPTLGFIAISLCILVCAVRLFRTSGFGESAFVISLAIASFLSLRSALVRSDVGHIAHAFAPMCFTFIVAGPAAFGLRKRVANVAWGIGFVVMALSWPFTGLASVTDLLAIVQTEPPVRKVWEQMRNGHTPPEKLLPPALIAQIHERPTVPMLSFPYDNFIPVLFNRPLVAPVLQNYSVGTLALENYYVSELRRRGSAMEVVYGIDDVAAWPVDGTQAVTRTPNIFRYLYDHYELTTKEYSDKGWYLLRARTAARNAALASLPYELIRENHNTGVLQLKSPTACGIPRVEMRIDYPIAKALLRPNPVVFDFQYKGRIVASLNIRPLATGEYFSTYFSTVPPEEFHKLFGENGLTARPWDTVRFSIPHTDKLSVNPSFVDVRAVECLDAIRFTADMVEQ